MLVIQLIGTVAWSVQHAATLRAQKNEDGTYNVEGDNFGFQSISTSNVLVLPDAVEIEAGQEIDPECFEMGLPLDDFLAFTPEMAMADALGLLLRPSVAEGAVTDDELLRIAPALEAREWRAGLAVQVGDVYACDGFIFRCIAAHTTEASWRPPLVPALWRRVEKPGDGPRVWQPLTDYVADDVVRYPDAQGPEYRCITGHMSQEGWEPPEAPALWEVQ